VITGVEVFGFFVELDRFFVSGLVHVNNLGDDFYEFWEEKFSLVGSNTGRSFTLGDTVTVRVLAVNKELRQIDFVLEGEPARDEDEAPGRRLRKAKSAFEGTSREKKPASRREEFERRRKSPGGRRRHPGGRGGSKDRRGGRGK
jgi:ribonuclease R